MDVSALIPTPDFLPVPWPWFKVLLVLTFVLHLLLMNLMLGGSLLTLFGRRREGVPPPARGIPTLIALPINMGVPPLLFVQVLFADLIGKGHDGVEFPLHAIGYFFRLRDLGHLFPLHFYTTLCKTKSLSSLCLYPPIGVELEHALFDAQIHQIGVDTTARILSPAPLTHLPKCGSPCMRRVTRQASSWGDRSG